MGQVNSARNAFWSKKTDSDMNLSSQVQSSGSQINECKEESQIRTISWDESDEPSPVLNVMEIAEKQEHRLVSGKKCLIFVQDHHYDFNESISKMWGNFLLQKAQHKSSEIISQDDFIVVPYNNVKHELNHLKRMMRDGEIQSMVVFNDQCKHKPDDLGNLLINEKHQIRLKDLIEGHTDVPLTICIMTPWSANASLRQLHDLSMNFNEAMKPSSANYLYPMASYQPNDNFCFEMATVFRVLVNQLSNYQGLEEVIQASQLDLNERLRSFDLLENGRICAISSSSFVYISSCDFERQNHPNQGFVKSPQEVPTSRIKKLDETIQATRKKGRIESSKSHIEAISMDLSGSAIALLNDNVYLKSKFYKQLFAISVAVLHSCSRKTGVTDVLNDKQIVRLWKEYSSKDDIPFSVEVWRASGTSTMAPRNMMKAIQKALYRHDSPEWKISNDVIRVISNEYSVFDNPFAEFTTLLEKIRTILPDSDDYKQLLTPGGTNIYYGIFLTPKGLAALEDMDKLHAIEAQYKSGADILGVWAQNKKTMFFEGGEPTFISLKKLSARLEKLCELTSSMPVDEAYPFGPVLDQRRDDEIAVSNWVELAKSMWEEME